MRLRDAVSQSYVTPTPESDFTPCAARRGSPREAHSAAPPQPPPALPPTAASSPGTSAAQARERRAVAVMTRSILMEGGKW